MCEAVEKLLKEAAEKALKVGRAEGEIEGRCNAVLELLHEGDISMDVACAMLNKSPANIESLLAEHYA